MAVFEYRGLSDRGRQVRGLVDADSLRGARLKLKGQGIFPTSVTESREPEATRGRFAFFDGTNRRISVAQLALTTRQLSTLVGAGMPLVESLKALGEQIDHPRLKRVIAETCDQVNEGSTVADAMRAFPKVFPRLYVNMVASGEMSGTLEVVLERLADLLEAQAALKRKIISALTYPILMVILCFGVVVLLLTYVIPQIAVMFEEKRATLPLPTRVVIGLSDFLRDYWFILGAGFMLVLIGTGRYLRTPGGRKRWDSIRLRLPVIGPMTLKIATSRFARNLGTLLHSGVELLGALSIVKNILGNVILEEVIEEASMGVREGKSLAAEIGRSGRFPRLLVHMVAIGEQTGQLENMLFRAATTYESEVSAVVAGLTSILEPILILLIAVVVGTILASVMLPMLEMSSLTV